LREGARGRGNLKGKPFTPTLTLPRQWGGNSFRISKSGFGTFPSLDGSISFCLPSLDGRGLRGG